MAAPERYVCIHGHFYQPPRENPWLETVEIQSSAAPYHDWNERITAECYAPNGAARVVNGKNKIIRILNNYGRISFNFGPTLLSWLQDNAHRVYQMILDADAMSQQQIWRPRIGDGAGVQPHHHAAGLAAGQDHADPVGHRGLRIAFGRKPEGMWLSETAVDSETLDLMAAHGIRFVVLAPHQCARVRPLAAPAKVAKAKAERRARSRRRKPARQPTRRHRLRTGYRQEGPKPLRDPCRRFRGQETPTANVDTTRAYLVRLNENRSIAVFFYDGPRSRAIAFEGLLNDGEGFARRLLSGFSDKSDHAQLVHVATDGESYGHHHRYGEMALAWALKWMVDRGRREADELRGVPGEVSTGVRGADLRRHVVELRAWRGALAVGLRMQQRSPGMEPAVEEAAARSPGLAAGYGGSVGEETGRDVVQRCGRGARWVYLGRARSQPRRALTPFWRSMPRATERHRRRHVRPGADGAGAARATDVHQLRMVLRRDFRH